MTATYQTGYNSTLALRLEAGATSISVATAPTRTKGRIKIGLGASAEWIEYTGVSGTTLTGVSRQMSKTAIPSVSLGNGSTWIAGTPIKLVAMHDQIPDINEDTNYLGTDTFIDINFTGTTTGGLKVKSLTTAQRNAITNAANGLIIYNSTTGVLNQYITGARSEIGDTGTPNASTTVAGKVEIPTNAQFFAGTDTGETGALLSVLPSQAQSIIHGATEKTIPVSADEFLLADSAASYAQKRITYGNLFTNISASVIKFGGTGADGAVDGLGNVTITGSNDTYIVKNYTTWAAGSAPRTLTVTPTNCIVHIKCTGNADFSNWTFEFDGKGGQHGVASASGASSNGMLSKFSTGGGGGSGAGGGAGGGGANLTSGVAGGNGAGTGGIASVAGRTMPLTGVMGRRMIQIDTGSAGGGGAGTGTLGEGGDGGGCLIIEVNGNIVFDNTTTVGHFRGTNGNPATAGNAGGGGGGGGGSFLAMYNGTLTGTFIPLITGGAGGALSGSGGTGGVGGDGDYSIQKNTVFA